jgi:L-cysteine S-thiosulfotransferase
MTQVQFFSLAFAGLLTVSTACAAETEAGAAQIETGRQLAHDFEKGNCLACHSAPTDKRAVTLANIAPPLLMMRERFPDRQALRAQIWDPTRINPNTIMPPFGKHQILSEREIDLIVDYLYTL